jgi:hypothetical protein
MRHQAAEQERAARQIQFRLVLLFIAAGMLLVVSAIVGYLSFRT